MPHFTIGEQDFQLDGQRFQILSGALHYFRVHPDHWADRIHKARLMGLNTIETYVPWNAHATTADSWVEDAGLDLGRFLDLVAAEGMQAIVRPGPYICAEWDNGGLPAWLFRDQSVGVRRLEPQYLAAVTDYLRRVYRIVAPRQVDNGGPVILVQIENEYGAYGSDQAYLAELIRVTRDAGIVVPLVSVDQPVDQMLRDGSADGLHKTASFGSNAVERLAVLRKHQPTGPLMCMEFWDGWFDDWGGHHHTTDAAATAAELDAILSRGGSVNIYMFHGGTNFGLTNGANDKGRYLPITTSYDYDAPLDEAGRPTAKYFAFREVLSRYAELPAEAVEPGSPAPEFEVALTESAPLLGLDDLVSAASEHGNLPTLDDLEHYRGAAIFSTRVNTGAASVLRFGEVRDRAWVFADGRPVGVLSRTLNENSLVLPADVAELTVIVEDQGRVSYGPRIGEHKGLIGGAALDGTALVDWTVQLLDLDRVPGAALAGGPPTTAPLVARGEFELAEPADLFLDTSAWGKGFAWVNGLMLGRYWRNGPQHTLYVPAPVTRAGSNTVTLLEFESLREARARFVSEPLLTPTEL